MLVEEGFVSTDASVIKKGRAVSKGLVTKNIDCLNITLSQDEKRSVRESAERKKRRVNRGERSRAFYTRYKYLQKCGWNTWNTHEEKERMENTAAVQFLHMRRTCRETYNKVSFKSVCIDSIQAGRVA